MTKTPPVVAVLLATHNGMKWLHEQIDSIQLQKNVRVRLFISDDDSTDGTRQWLQKHLQEGYAKLLPAMQFGKASTNFFRLLMGVDLTEIDFVAFSDQDDIWLDNKLSRATDTLLSQQIDAYSSNVTAFWPDGKQTIIHKAQPSKKYDFMFESAGPGCTFVLSKKLALDLQYFIRANDEACLTVDLHDWFIYAFARSRGYTWFIDRVPAMLYRQHANNVVGANKGFKAIIARWKKLNQRWFSQQILVIAHVLDYANQWPIRRLSRLSPIDRVVLAINVCKMRRRLRDQFALAIYLLWIAKK